MELIARLGDGTALERSEAISKLIGGAHQGPSVGALLECLNLCQQGKIRTEDLAPHTDAILRMWKPIYEQVSRAQQEGTSTEWMFEDEYRHARAEASVVLHFFGYLPGLTVIQELGTAIKLVDPRLKAFAVISLIRRGESVDPAEIESVGASHEARLLLWDELKKLGMTQLMPERWSAPDQLAASNLVQWAAHPMEMGTPPEEIELMTTYLVNFDGKEVEVFLFRFREYPKPWAKSEGWMAGIAGPFIDGENIGNPWSAFAPWDSKTPDEHFKKLMANISWCEMDDNGDPQ